MNHTQLPAAHNFRALSIYLYLENECRSLYHVLSSPLIMMWFESEDKPCDLPLLWVYSAELKTWYLIDENCGRFILEKWRSHKIIYFPCKLIWVIRLAKENRNLGTKSPKVAVGTSFAFCSFLLWKDINKLPPNKYLRVQHLTTVLNTLELEPQGKLFRHVCPQLF